MNNDAFQLVHYGISAITFVASLLLYLLRGQFVSKAAFEAFAEDLSKKVSERALYVDLETHRKETRERFSAGSERMAELTALIGRVELALKNLPSKDDLHELALSLRDVGGDLKAIRAETAAHDKDLEELRKTQARHEDILSQGGRA
jgi:hypothetical protein